MLSFQSGGGDTLDKIPLAEKEQNDDGQYGQAGHGHDIFPDNYGFRVYGQPQSQGDGEFSHTVDINKGIEIVVICPQKLE